MNTTINTEVTTVTCTFHNVMSEKSVSDVSQKTVKMILAIHQDYDVSLVHLFPNGLGDKYFIVTENDYVKVFQK